MDTWYEYPWSVMFEKSSCSSAMYQLLSDYSYIGGGLGFVYLGFTSILQILMTIRQTAFDLSIPLRLWNLINAVICLFAVFRLSPDIMYGVDKFGFLDSFWNFPPLAQTPVIQGWIGFWALYKAWQLGDTMFVLLRKRRFTLLHGFQHVTSLAGIWYIGTFEELAGFLRWMMAINFMVLFLSYSYYWVAAQGIRPPRWVALIITLVQTAEPALAIYMVQDGLAKKQISERVLERFIMEGIFLVSLVNFVLYAHYFYIAYLKPEKPKTKSQ